MASAYPLLPTLEPWLRVALQAAHGETWPGHEILILTAHKSATTLVRRTVEALIDGRRRTSGEPVRLLVVEEPETHLGNLIGTVRAFEQAQALARAEGWDLTRAVHDGRPTCILHGAGSGRRARALTLAEALPRSLLPLPGCLRGAPPRVLTAVLSQAAPLALSCAPGIIDVLWVSQLFFPTLDPLALSRPSAPLSKLATRREAPPSGPHDRADLGLFHLDPAGSVCGFTPQGAPLTHHAPSAADLGSCRIRLDLIDVLSSLLRRVPPRPLDLDPDLTAPLLGGAAPSHLSDGVLEAFAAEPLVHVELLGTDIPWFRLRRPEEFRALAMAIRPSRPEGEPVRRTLGISSPILRSWVADRWFEGSEIGWGEARSGIQLGDVWLRDSVIHDCAVPEGHLEGSVLSWCCGPCDATDSLLVASGSRGGHIEASVVWRGRGAPRSSARPPLPFEAKSREELDAASVPTVPIPPAVIELIARKAPFGTLRTLRQLAEGGAFLLHLHEGARGLDVDVPPRPGLTLIQGTLPLHIDVACYQRYRHAPQALAEALLRCWLRFFVGPAAMGREPYLAHRLTALRADPDPILPTSPAELLEAVAEWCWAADPDRSRLEPLLLALDATNPVPADLQSPHQVRAWLRLQLAHRHASADEVSRTLAQLPRQLQQAVGASYPALGLRGPLPTCDLRPPIPPVCALTSDQLLEGIARWAVARSTPPKIGLCGPAAAGKSTLAHGLCAILGLPALQADAMTWPGDGFRYRQHLHHRDVFLYGPGIYDDDRIATALARTPEGGVADGVYLGLDPRVAAQLDLSVGVIADDRQRLRDKIARDDRPGGRRIDLHTDFMHKILHESHDALRPLLPRCDLIWDRSSGAVWASGTDLREALVRASRTG
ncbi:MAG: hypothetical protein EA397_08670 [Deltaproteobacteria bacterium]|nr:MAG: hypothetical protein EA397_08670 [Deltaproteobacteria bacterium]